MARLYMMVGLPGSGKSHYTKTMDATVVSTDTIREELFGDMNDQSHNNEVFNEVHKRIYSCLKQGVDAVYDATNLSRKRRRAFLKTLPEGTLKYAIVMCTDYDICLRNNNNRDRHVPEEVIRKMFTRMTIPTYGIPEGFDEISYIRHPDNTLTDIDYFQKCVGFDQDNPNHTLTLSEHTERAYNIVHEKAEKSNLDVHQRELLCRATLFHDIGKPVCKTYEKFDGTVDNHAHYYNHAEVGAYMMLCARDLIPAGNPVKGHAQFVDRVMIATLIQSHMRFFDNNFEMDEFVINTCPDMGTMLELLHEADVSAH